MVLMMKVDSQPFVMASADYLLALAAVPSAAAAAGNEAVHEFFEDSLLNHNNHC